MWSRIHRQCDWVRQMRNATAIRATEQPVYFIHQNTSRKDVLQYIWCILTMCSIALSRENQKWIAGKREENNCQCASASMLKRESECRPDRAVIQGVCTLPRYYTTSQPYDGRGAINGWQRRRTKLIMCTLVVHMRVLELCRGIVRKRPLVQRWPSHEKPTQNM